MAGTYYITENLSDSYKFKCKVQFNAKTAEYYEIDSLDSATIDSTLQKVADDDISRAAQEAVIEVEANKIIVADGKIVVEAAIEEVI